MDQIYKTDLNELFSYQRKGEKLEEKEKVIEIEIERLRDFKEQLRSMPLTTNVSIQRRCFHQMTCLLFTACFRRMYRRILSLILLRSVMW